MELFELIQSTFDFDRTTFKFTKIALDFKQFQNNLTRREREILPLITQGMSAIEIARIIGLSHRTIENHRNKILSKFNVSRVSELNRQAAIYETLSQIGMIDS